MIYCNIWVKKYFDNKHVSWKIKIFSYCIHSDFVYNFNIIVRKCKQGDNYKFKFEFRICTASWLLDDTFILYGKIVFKLFRYFTLNNFTNFNSRYAYMFIYVVLFLPCIAQIACAIAVNI